MSRCPWKRDLQLSTNLGNSCSADTTIHDGFADWADAGQVRDLLRDRLVVGHRARRESRRATPEAVHLARLARLLVLGSALLQEGHQVAPFDQNRPSIVDCRKPFGDPPPNRVPMAPEQGPGFLNRVGAVNLDQTMVQVTFAQVGSLTAAIKGLQAMGILEKD